MKNIGRAAMAKSGKLKMRANDQQLGVPDRSGRNGGFLPPYLVFKVCDASSVRNDLHTA